MKPSWPVLRMRSTPTMRSQVSTPLPHPSWRRRPAIDRRAPEDRTHEGGIKCSTEPITSVIVKSGTQLKVKGKGVLGTPLASDPRPVDLVLKTGTRMRGAQFGGTNGGVLSFKTGKEVGRRTGRTRPTRDARTGRLKRGSLGVTSATRGEVAAVRS